MPMPASLVQHAHFVYTRNIYHIIYTAHSYYIGHTIWINLGRIIKFSQRCMMMRENIAH